MKSYSKPIKRRKFLRTGIVGGVAGAAIPLWKLSSFSTLSSDSFINTGCKLSNESVERIIEISLKYGSEFAGVHGKYKY